MLADALEQIPECGKRQRDLRLDRSADQDALMPLFGGCATFPPKRRLADPDLSVKKKSARARSDGIEKLVDRARR